MERWFTATPDEVRAARHWVTESLATHGCDRDGLDRAALITTELAANVLDHTTSDRVGVIVTYANGTARIEVVHCDPSAQDPNPRDLVPESDRGRGLLLVEAMSSAWGTSASADGRTVWAEVPCATAFASR